MFENLENAQCEMYYEYQRENRKTGEKYWDRKFIRHTQYKFQEGDELNRKGTVVRMDKEGNRELFRFFTPIVATVPKTIQPVKQESVITTLEEELGDSICSLVNAIIETKNSKILRMYVKNNRVFADWEKNGDKKVTSSNPLKFK